MLKTAVKVPSLIVKLAGNDEKPFVIDGWLFSTIKPKLDAGKSVEFIAQGEVVCAVPVDAEPLIYQTLSNMGGSDELDCWSFGWRRKNGADSLEYHVWKISPEGAIWLSRIK